MKTQVLGLFRLIQVATCCLSLLCPAILHAEATGSDSTSVVELEKTPPLTHQERSQFRVNLAREAFGASIRSSQTAAMTDQLESILGGDEENQSIQALITADSSISYPLPKGKTSVIITLPYLGTNDLFSFINGPAGKGTVTVSVASSSLDFSSPKWKTVGKPVSFEGNGPVEVPFPPTECNNVKIDFDITSEEDRVSAFGVFGDTLNSGLVEKPRSVKEDLPVSEIVHYDYADVTNGSASVIYVSSHAESNELEKANTMIDGNSTVGFEFAPEDSAPTAIIDLGASEQVRRISVAYTGGTGRLEVYILNGLPGDEATVARLDNNPDHLLASIQSMSFLPFLLAESQKPQTQLLNIPAKFFRDNSPFHVAETNPERNRTSTTFQVTSVRYVLLRWVEDTGANTANTWGVRKPGFGFIPMFLGQTTPPSVGSSGGFVILEVNVFGNTARRYYTFGQKYRERGLEKFVDPKKLVPPDVPSVSP